MADTKNISAAQRASNFAASTREYVQMLPAVHATGGSQTLSFALPKARLLASIGLDVVAKVTITGAANIPMYDNYAPYRILRRIAVNANNGFQPYTLTGGQMALYNAMRSNPELVAIDGAFCHRETASGSPNYNQFAASSGGVENTLIFHLDLPVTLNPRDPTGLILLQNATTNVTVDVDIGAGAEIIGNAAGYTVAVTSVGITPSVKTFSFPAIDEAQPDLTVIKLVNAMTEEFTGGVEHIVKFPVGNIYRKIGLRFYSESGGVATGIENFNSNIELIMNQADRPYSISASALKMRNVEQYNGVLPDGVFTMDFSSGMGLPNLSGTRDYVDTENLTEMWLSFTAATSGKLEIVSEKLARVGATN